MSTLLVSLAPDFAPFLLLLIGMVTVITLITVARLHAFFALVLAAMVVGLLTPATRFPGSPNAWVDAIEMVTKQLGETGGKIALVIAFAAIIGMCMGESGAADKVVRRFLAVSGEKRAGAALVISGYVLSIPIFFDTFFMLLVPLAQALSRRTGKNYTLYVLAICCGSIVTHSLVVPHPGPLAMAEALHLDLGLTILVGLAVGTGPVFVGWLTSRVVAARVPVEAPPLSPEQRQLVDRPETELPGFWWSLAPVLVPIALIGAASAVAAWPAWRAGHASVAVWIEFLGNRNVALMLGTLMALALLAQSRGLTFLEVGQRMTAPLETAAVIILITSAGGAFGFMLRNAGVGEAVQALAAGLSLNLILLAWLVAAVIRVAQGSATVAMLTTAAMLEPVIAAAGLPYHPVYIFLAIGFGAYTLSWMNDSGFWVVSRLSGFTEKQTLKTFSVVLSVSSVSGLVVTLLLSRLMPLR